MTVRSFQFKDYKLFFFVIGFYLLMVAIILLFTEKGEPEVFINKYYNTGYDIFFKYFTLVGDGWFYAAFAFLLLFIRFYYVLVSVVSILITSAFVHFFKLVLFHEAPRPMEFLPKSLTIHLVEGVHINFVNSFPSGHTSVAFCMAMITVYVIECEVNKRRRLTAICIFLLAFLAGFSRIYLMQHFLIDTFVGAIFGTGFALLTIVLFDRFTNLKNAKFWNLSLLRLKD